MATGNIKEVSFSMSIIVLTTYILNVMAIEIKCSFCKQIIKVETGWDRGYRELNPVQGNWFHMYMQANDPQLASAIPNKIVQVTNIWCGSESLNTLKKEVIQPEYNIDPLKKLHLEVNEGNTYVGLLQHACMNEEVAYLTGAMGVFNTFQLVKHEEKEKKSFLQATLWEVKNVKEMGEDKVSLEFRFRILVNSV